VSVAASKPGVIGATIVMRSGKYFDFLRPEMSEFTILDIAAGLSRICRYGGQLPDDVPHYSVAQHSVIVSRIVPPEDALAGLLHDAAEAFTGDMVSPLKQLCPDFKAVEKRVEAAIFDRFGLPAELPPSVKRADLIALHTEKRDISAARGHAWPNLADYPPLPDRIAAWPQPMAFRVFLGRFHDLVDARRLAKVA
jgi:hypothetical protein